MCQVSRDCHNLSKDKVWDKATVATWATKCMGSRARSTVEVQEAWAVDTINLEDRAIKPVAMELTGLVMAQDSMEIAIEADGVPIMGTKVSVLARMLLSDDSFFTWACTLLSHKW